MKDKYTFDTKHKDIQERMSANYNNFREGFTSKDTEGQKKAYDSFYSDKELANVGNYVTYFQKITDVKLLDFIIEQVGQMKSKLAPAKK